MSSTASVEVKVRAFRSFLDDVLMTGGERILVAFSGGPDSTALLACAIAYAESTGRAAVAAYFNHHLRGAAEVKLEGRHVQDASDQLGIPLCIGCAAEGEIESLAVGKGISIEAAARIKRYQFLETAATSHECAAIVTGHTGDDLTETLIQRFFQGSGIGGLKGIPKISGRVIRPLLTWSREDVNAFNTRSGLMPFDDSTNCQNVYLRNQIRNTLAPAIEAVFPGYRGSLSKLALKMALANDYIDTQMQKRESWEKKNEVFSMPLNLFVSMHPVERVESLSAVLDGLQDPADGTFRIPYGSFRDVISLPKSITGRILFRSGGMRLCARGHRVFLEPDVVFTGGKGYFILIKECMAAGWFESIASVGMRVRVVPSADAAALLPAESIEYPLIIRSRRDGDAVKLGGSARSLKNLYNEWQVPVGSRWKIAVCEDRKGIVAVIGTPFGFKDVRRSDIAISNTEGSYAFKLF